MFLFSLKFTLFLIFNLFPAQIVGGLVTASNDKSGEIGFTSQSRLCGSVYTSAGKTVIFREGIPPSVEEFEKVHERKMKHAKINPERRCAINICGFSSWRTGEYGDCELFQEATTADYGVYNDKYNTSALMCGCNRRDEDCSNECPIQASEMTWKGSECAVMFQEHDCKSCYFQPVILSDGEHFIQNYTHHILSIIVRENCSLEQQIPAFAYVKFRYMPTPSLPIVYDGGSTFTDVPSAYQSDPEIFSCTCASNSLASHLESITPDTAHISRSGNPILSQFPRNSVPSDAEGTPGDMTYLIVGVLGVILFAAAFNGLFK